MLKIHSGRQEVVSAIATINHADLASGVAGEALYVPQGAIIVGGFIAVTEAFNSATSDTFDIGTKSDGDLYGDGLNLAAEGVTQIKPSGVKHGAEPIVVEWTGTGKAPTEGEVLLVVNYVIEGRAAFAHGPEDRLVPRPS